MMEIDARLNALQKFMKENMPWCKHWSNISNAYVFKLSSILLYIPICVCEFLCVLMYVYVCLSVYMFVYLYIYI